MTKTTRQSSDRTADDGSLGDSSTFSTPPPLPALPALPTLTACPALPALPPQVGPPAPGVAHERKARAPR